MSMREDFVVNDELLLPILKDLRSALAHNTELEMRHVLGLCVT